MSTTDRLNKSFKNIAQTSDQRSDSEELLSRFTSVPAERSVQAAKVVGDLRGSWVESTSVTTQISQGLRLDSPNQENKRYFSIGQPNFPEINFRPYDYGTNRGGDKCPSTIGHPISFEVVGPTVRSSALNLQWLVTNNSGTSDGDVLTIDPQSVLSPSAGPATDSTTTTIESTYGFPDLAPFPGGLYVIISQTGESGYYNGADGGLSDGYVYDLSGTYVPIQAKNRRSKFEIFRVRAMDVDYLELEPSKRLEDYFDIAESPDVPVLRAITLIQPRVARTVALPSSEGPRGREMVFAIVPPETSLNSDFMPPYDGGNSGDGTWLQGGFETFGATTTGNSNLYNENVLLPSGKVLAEITGSLFEVDEGTLSTVDIGYWVVKVDADFVDINHAGKILRITELNKRTTAPSGTSELSLNALARGKYSLNSVQGFFEIEGVDPIDNFYTLKRICEFNPITGKLTYGDSEGLVLPALNIFSQKVAFKGYIHDTIYDLHRKTQLDLEELRQTVLHTIINPNWAQASKSPSLGEGTGYTIFNTVQGENPGNLLDLGFNPILYPAIESDTPGEIIPDWNSPIREGLLQLNPALSSTQELKIDYSSGLIYLSTQPIPGVGCDVAPHGVLESTNDNPRDEIILFISCVPFSRDTLEKGVSVASTLEAFDGNKTTLLGGRKFYPLKAHVDGVELDPDTFSGSNTQIPLAIPHSEDDLPDAGKFYYTTNNTPFSYRSNSSVNFAFGYCGKEYATDSVTGREYVKLIGVYGGSASGFSAVSNIQDGNLNIVPLKNYPDKSVDGELCLPLIASDYSYGAQFRTREVTFKGSAHTQSSNGALGITFPALEGAVRNSGHLLANHYISGGDLGLNTGLYYIIESIQCSFDGLNSTLPESEVILTDDSTNYVYLYRSKHSLEFPYPKLGVSLTAPEVTDNILLYNIVTVGGSVTSVVDLRNTVKDLNLKVEVFAGQANNYKIGSFATLGEAVKYVGVIDSAEANIYKIVVKGLTVEPETIYLPKNGLIIEGVSLEQTGPTPVAGISWNFDSGCLIDFNGKTDCIFRDLIFTLDPVGLSASAVVGDLTVFKGSGSNILIENCNFYGSDIASNFVVFDEVFDSSIKNCVISAVSRPGIRNNLGHPCTRINIENCTISQGAYAPPLTITSAIYFASDGSLSKIASFINITGCKVTGFTRGIYLSTFRSLVGNNYITNTLLEGIVCTHINSDAYNTIENNYLDEVYINSTPGRVAIECEKDGNVVTNNYISFYDPSSTPFRTGISVSDSVSTKVSENRADGAILLAATATQTLVYANEVLALNVLGDANSIVGNYLTEVFSFSSATGALVVEGENNSISSNICESDVYVSADGNSFVGNIIGSDSNPSSMYIHSSKNSVTSNRILLAMIVDNGATKNMISSNYINGKGAGTGIIISGNCNYNIITSNSIDNGNIDCSGSHNTISCNEIRDLGFGGDILLQVGALASTVNANFVFGDINVYDDQAIISNNWLLGLIRMDGLAYIITGNNTSNILSTAGTDPDATGVVVANRVLSGTIFGVAVSGSAKDNNV